MTSNFIDQFGFNDEKFADQDDIGKWVYYYAGFDCSLWNFLSFFNSVFCCGSGDDKCQPSLMWCSWLSVLSSGTKMRLSALKKLLWAVYMGKQQLIFHLKCPDWANVKT